VSATVGTLVGAFVGLAGGWVDEVAMRVVDVLLAFPGILLAIAVTAVLGPGLDHVVFALCLLGWVGYARLVRGQVLALREREYVQAAVALGASRTRIVLRHLLPNVMAPVLVEATFGMAGAIVGEALIILHVLSPRDRWRVFAGITAFETQMVKTMYYEAPADMVTKLAVFGALGLSHRRTFLAAGGGEERR